MNTYYTLRGFFFVFFLLGNMFYLVAQEKFAFSDSHIKKEIRSIFAHDKGLDSFHLIVNDNNLSRLKVFRSTDPTIVYHNEIELDRPLIYRGFSFYDLGFEGDMFFLKKDFPEMYEFVVNTKLQREIKSSKKDKFFTIAFTPQKSYLRRTDQGSIYAVLQPSFQGFVKELDLQYPYLKPVVKDSILILQAVVDQSGRLLDKIVLYGEMSGIYSYFFG